MLELDSWYKNTSIREMHSCDYNCYFNMIGNPENQGKIASLI